MIIDAHTHICSKEVRTDRARFLCPEEIGFSAIYSDPRSRLSGAEELIRAMDEDGVDRSVTFSFPWVSEETARRQNDYVIEAQERFPQRLIGLACFDPLQPWAEREAIRALDAGLQGLGELAIYAAGFDQTSIERLADLGRLCRERNVPLLVHVNEPIGHSYPGKAPLTVKMIYDLARATQGVKLILAHWGGGLFFYHLLKKEVSEVLTNVYFDTAASPFLYRPEIYPTADRILGPEKILFGSDFPLLKPGRYFKEMATAGLEEKSIRLIKGDAAARVFIKEGG